jgi:hypothetical protein
VGGGKISAYLPDLFETICDITYRKFSKFYGQESRAIGQESRAEISPKLQLFFLLK